MAQTPATDRFPVGRIFGVDDGLLDLRSYIATRRAVQRGEAIYDLSAAARQDQGFMNPWLFNVQQTILATLPASLSVWFLTEVFGSPGPDPTLAGRELFFSQIMRDLEPILGAAFIPLTLLATAPMMAWASFRPNDRTPAAQRRNTWAYLYIDGAYGLWAQSVAVLFLTLSAWVDAWPAGQQPVVLFDFGNSAARPFLIFAILAFLIASIKEAVVYFRRVPETLFALNGYLPKIGLFRRVKHPNAGPINRYNTTAIFGTALVSMAISGVLYGIAASIAWTLAAIKALILGVA